MIKLLLENFKKYLLLELRLEEVLPKLDSNKFVNASNYHKINPEKAKKLILDTVPDDVEDSEKANYLNWRIKQFMVNGAVNGPNPKYVEIFYTIKANSLDRLLAKNDINSFESVEEFSDMMKSSSRKYLTYQKKKKESTVDEKDINKIYEDENWEVFIPESKAASCRLGTGTNWCTASRGRRNYYNKFHSKENPLIIFISKQNSEEKYQFHYETSQFMNVYDSPINSTRKFYKLNEILKNLSGILPENVVSAAKKFDWEDLPGGGHIQRDHDAIVYWNENNRGHSYNGLPAVETKNGYKAWYQDGKIHRDNDLPAIIDVDGTKEWLQRGKHHRDNDLPAIDSPSGFQMWYQNGKRHRDGDLPASIWPNGKLEWYKHGLRHRDGDQPAIIEVNGTKEWWQNGVLIKTQKPPRKVRA
jgi:hypothetical protein